jgi:hypothetical protein
MVNVPDNPVNPMKTRYLGIKKGIRKGIMTNNGKLLQCVALRVFGLRLWVQF